MCQASLENGVKKFIYTSSTEVYGSALYVPMDEKHPFNPTNAYGASKAAGEFYTLAYWRSYGLPSAVVRLYNVYGPRENSEGIRAEVTPKFVMRVMADYPRTLWHWPAITCLYLGGDTVRCILKALNVMRWWGSACTSAGRRKSPSRRYATWC